MHREFDTASTREAMLSQDTPTPQKELKFWLPEEYEKILKISSDLGFTQLMKFTQIFYDEDMQLVLDFPTFNDSDVFLNEYAEQFCRRIYCDWRFAKTDLEFRVSSEVLYSFPLTFLLRKK
jgi:hypothetical protein